MDNRDYKDMTGICLKQHDSIAESSYRSFLQYFHAAFSSHLSKTHNIECYLLSGFHLLDANSVYLFSHYIHESIINVGTV